MRDFIIDHYALGLHPRGYDLLIELIDLEIGLSDSPDTLYVLGFILDGWSQRETARHLSVHHKTIQNHVARARRALGNHYLKN
jgi:hypothetical protein